LHDDYESSRRGLGDAAPHRLAASNRSALQIPKIKTWGTTVSPIIESRTQDKEASKASKAESHVANKFPHGT
jgi:hypothetical protein